jgi:hypothetical protein
MTSNLQNAWGTSCEERGEVELRLSSKAGGGETGLPKFVGNCVLCVNLTFNNSLTVGIESASVGMVPSVALR